MKCAALSFVPLNLRGPDCNFYKLFYFLPSWSSDYRACFEREKLRFQFSGESYRIQYCKWFISAVIARFGVYTECNVLGILVWISYR